MLEQSTAAALWHLCAGVRPRPQPPGARLVRVLPVGRLDGRPAPVPGVTYGEGLDARRFADLSSLHAPSPSTPTEGFFIRTTAPRALDAAAAVELVGRRRDAMSPGTLRAMSRDMGTHLMECAGNTDPANFGLMSVAGWHGVPLADVIDRLGPLSDGALVEVAGVDPSGPSRSSAPGASWMFSRSQIEQTGAFLATDMNGRPLAADHGHPVRLVIPGWYGCASIKWVRSIAFVSRDAVATAQMREFASRTHQDGVPDLAADYLPPVIDVAATPVRVEQWHGPDADTFFRVVGIVWGGPVAPQSLEIRFSHREPFVRVTDYGRPANTSAWSLWSHVWRPREPGRYQIVLRADSSVRTRRLDAYFYTREISLDRV